MTPSSVRAHRLGWLYPSILIRLSFGFGLALVLLVAGLYPSLALVLPLAILGGIIGWALFRHPRLNLFVVLGSFTLVASFEEGVDPGEVAYGLFYVGYLAQWYGRRLLLERRRLLETHLDGLVIVLFVFVVCYAAVGFLFGGPIPAIVAELQSWTYLLFYFPVKDAIERQDNGLRWLLLVIGWFGVFVVVRNAYQYVLLLGELKSIWQITLQGRIVTNEFLILVPGYLMLMLAIKHPELRARLVYFVLFLAMMFGLIITQGRGYWLGCAFGLGVLFLIGENRMRLQMVMWALLALVGSLGLLFLLLPDLAQIIVSGLLNRVLSIGKATSGDVSFASRMIEWKAVFADIKLNPVLGYGMGVPIKYFDITRDVTMIRPWIHSGYVGVWFKYGLVGLAMFFGILLVAMRYAWVAIRRSRHDWLVSTAAYSAFAGLASVFVSTIPTNMFQNSDTILMIVLLMAMAAGCRSLSKRPSEVAGRLTGA